MPMLPLSRASFTLDKQFFTHFSSFFSSCSLQLQGSDFSRVGENLCFFFECFIYRKVSRAAHENAENVEMITLRFWQDFLAFIIFQFLSLLLSTFYCSTRVYSNTRVTRLHEQWLSAALMNGKVVQCLINFHYKLMWLLEFSHCIFTLSLFTPPLIHSNGELSSVSAETLNILLTLTLLSLNHSWYSILEGRKYSCNFLCLIIIIWIKSENLCFIIRHSRKKKDWKFSVFDFSHDSRYFFFPSQKFSHDDEIYVEIN